MFNRSRLKKLAILFYLLTPTLLFSQGFNAGIRAGICGTQVDGDTYEGFNKAGITAGIFVSRKLSDNFSLQLELNYIQKGSRKPLDDFNTFYLMRLNYVEVPLLLQWHASKNIDIFAGPSLAKLLNYLEETEMGVYQGPLFEKYEIAARIGISYKLSEQWSVDGRYSNSITTIRPSPAAHTLFYDKGQYNRLIEIGLSYKF